MKKIKNLVIIISLMVFLLIIWGFTNSHEWSKLIITRFVSDLKSYFDTICHFVERLWHRIFSERYEWGKLIITTFVGGLLSYFYVMYRENKKEVRDIQRENEKDERRKREKCTIALLNTQMTISLQMEELKGLEKICLSIMNFNLSGNTLAAHLQNIEGVSAKASKLQELINHQEEVSISDLLKFTHHLIITPPVNTIIILPQEIFSLPPIRFKGVELTVTELAIYFKGIATCNRRYMQIISSVIHHNEIRNIVINQPIPNGKAEMRTLITQEEELQKLLRIIAALLNLALTLTKQIDSYFEKADMIFTKAGDYIQLLDIAPSIQVARDERGKIIFN